MNAQQLINKLYENRDNGKLMIVIWRKEDKSMPAAILGCTPAGLIENEKVSVIVTHLSQFFTDEFEFQFVIDPNLQLTELHQSQEPTPATVH